MTREEAINIMKVIVHMLEEKYDTDRVEEAVDMAIKVLEQEPTTKENLVVGDCISRAELLKAVDTWDKFGCDTDTKLVPVKDCYVPYIHYDDVVKAIKGMPSVQPKPKIGHWEQYGYSWEDKFKCSECGKEQPKILCGERIIGHWSDYCPNCGADMRESEE